MEKSEGAAKLVVCDAGPLIHLDEVGCIDLLSDFSQVLVPTAVWNEVARHCPSALTAPDVQLFQTSCRTPPSAEFDAIARLFALDIGEFHALRIAEERQADILLTDDAAARLAARQLAIPVHGTIGILLRAVRRRQRTRDEVLATLRSVPTDSTLHLKRSLLEEIIRAVEAIAPDE